MFGWLLLVAAVIWMVGIVAVVGEPAVALLCQLDDPVPTERFLALGETVILAVLFVQNSIKNLNKNLMNK